MVIVSSCWFRPRNINPLLFTARFINYAEVQPSEDRF